MGLPRSTYYDAPPVKTDDAEIVANIAAICDEFEAYGYRRVGAELRHRGMVVNSKKIRRLMREQDLQPKRRRRFVATTDSDHDNPIFPDLARDRIVTGPNQLWVADITYIAIATGFVYLAAILDAWSRRVVGYAISRSIRCPRCCCGTEGGDPSKTAADGLYSPLGSWFAIRLRALSPPVGRTWSRRLHGPTWQSL
jgi:putative transposase